jgi:salicylate hydroxylase
LAIDASKPVYVNGAGIAGLTTALVLAKAGYRVRVFERAEGFETIGAGLQLSPNAMRVLSSLGLAEKILAVAVEPDALVIRSGRWNWQLASLTLGDKMKRRFGERYLVIHRADLQQVLFSACQYHPQISVEFSSEITEMAPYQRGVTISLRQNGDEFEHAGVAAIVADGVWSKLRTQVMQLDPPVYSGKVAWRAVFPASSVWSPDALNQVSVWFGPRSHVVAYPVRSGRQLNMVVITRGPATSDGQTLSAEVGELLPRFKRWRAPFVTLMEEQARWTGWPLFETPKPDRLHIGSVALVGDAAHGMLPFAAQGAAMAIEDAAVLGSCFMQHDTVTDAMEAYSRARLARVSKVMKTARKNGEIYHLGFPASSMRNIGMKLLPESMLSKRQDWIYSWRVD